MQEIEIRIIQVGDQKTNNRLFTTFRRQEDAAASRGERNLYPPYAIVKKPIIVYTHAQGLGHGSRSHSSSSSSSTWRSDFDKQTKNR